MRSPGRTRLKKPNPTARAARRERGVVMIIVLFAAILLAALVFYVINIGQQANLRVTTQHSADAAAAAGAGWVARSLNTVASNNIAIARLISTVGVLDAMPAATEYTHIDQVALQEVLDDQLNAQIHDPWVRDALIGIRDEIAEEVVKLGPMRDLYNTSGYDVREMTFYDTPAGVGDGRGKLWQAMVSLDQYSESAMQNLGMLAQVNAVRGGEANLQTERRETMAFMAPYLPSIPWQRGSFGDFERPVRHGLLPEGLDDEVTNRGPWDAVFGFRHEHRDRGTVSEVGKGNVPIGSQVTTRSGEPSEPLSYAVHGDHSWGISRMGGVRLREVPHSRFAYVGQHWMSRPLGQTVYWVNHLASVKLDYLWAGNTEEDVGLKEAVKPEWVNSFSVAAGIADAGNQPIHQTRFIAIEIKSKYQRLDPQFMSDGSWVYVTTEQQINPRVAYASGWQDPRTWGVNRVASYIWRDEWQYLVESDPEIGMDVQFDQFGNLVMQPVYRIDSFVFAGANVGELEPIRNPHNFSSFGDLPGPITFNRSQIDRTAASTRQYLTFFAVAAQDDRALLWPSRFRGGKPYAHMVGVTQAMVFNDHSWDLWTPMWQAKLETVSDYSEWLNLMEGTIGDVSAISLLSPERVASCIEYLRNTEDLAEVMLNH